MKKPYLMNITETKTKQFIVWAEDRKSAIKDASDIYSCGGIDMGKESPKASVSVQFKATEFDLDIFKQYDRSVIARF